MGLAFLNLRRKEMLYEEVKESDFDYLMFKVHLMPDKADPLEFFPKLKMFPEFKAKVDGIKAPTLIKYIALTYDLNSPFLKETNVARRKVEVGRYMNLQVTGEGKFIPVIESMMKCEIPEINKMIVRYVRLQNNHKYSLLVALDENFYKRLEKTMDDVDEKAQEIKATTDMANTIQQLASDLFNKDNSPKLSDDMFRFIEEEKLELSPEFIAEKIRKGQVPVKLKGDRV